MKGWEWLPLQCCAEPDLPDGLTISFLSEALRTYRNVELLLFKRKKQPGISMLRYISYWTAVQE